MESDRHAAKKSRFNMFLVLMDIIYIPKIKQIAKAIKKTKEKIYDNDIIGFPFFSSQIMLMREKDLLL